MAGYPVSEAHSFNTLQFDNLSHYLTTTTCPANDSKYVFSGDFTMEAWISLTALPAVNVSKTIISSYSNSAQQYGKSFALSVYKDIGGSTFLTFNYSTDGINWLNSNSSGWPSTVWGAYPFQTATWYHIAICRSGNNYNLFVNGFLIGQYTAASAVANFAGPVSVTIGIDSSYTSFFNGYISNVRVVKGTAVYTAASTAGVTYFSNSTVSYTNPNPSNVRSFIPPIVNLTATQSAGAGGSNINAIGGNSTVNTSLLVCQNTSSGTYTQAFIDNSSYAQKMNAVGYIPNLNTSVSPSLPYPGYFSTSFSGVTQALSTAVTANTSWAMGQGDFTVEAWVYINTLAVNTGIVSAWAGSLAAPTANACCFSLTTGSTNAANVRFTVSNTSVATGYESTIGGLITGAWNHVAAVRIANTLNIYTNGVKTYAGTAAAETTNINCANAVCVIGAVSTTNSFINAYISNARVIKALGAYTNTFTPYLYPLANTLASNTGLTNYNTIATAVAGTSGVQLLACRYRTLTPENSINGYVLTSTGAPVATANITPQYIQTDNNLLSIVQQPKSNDVGPNFLTIPGNANFNLGSATAFTIEGWFWPTSLTVGPTLISSYPTSTTGVGYWRLGLTTGGLLTLNYDGATAVTTTTQALVAGTWNHVAVTRTAAGVYAFYVNGAVATGTVTSTLQFGNTAASIWVGSQESTGPTATFTGLSNNIRITRGIVVYTGAFTPPSANLGTTQASGTNIAAIPLAANVGLLIQANSTGGIVDTSPTAATISVYGNPQSNTYGVVNTTSNSVYSTTKISSPKYTATGDPQNNIVTRKLQNIQPATSSVGLNVAKAATTVDTINIRKNAILLSQVSIKALIPYFKQYTITPDIPLNIRKNSIPISLTAGIDKSITGVGSITLVNDVYPTTLYKQLNSTTFQFWS